MNGPVFLLYLVIARSAKQRRSNLMLHSRVKLLRKREIVSPPPARDLRHGATRRFDPLATLAPDPASRDRAFGAVQVRHGEKEWKNSVTHIVPVFFRECLCG